MHINVNTRTTITRQSEADFVVPILVDILSPGPFGQPATVDFIEPETSEAMLGTEFLVGRVWAERMDWSEAEECRFSIAAICDAASPVWLEVFETLTKNGRRLRRDLQLDDFVQDIVFLHEILIHPEVGDRLALIDAVIRSITNGGSLVVMQYDHSSPHHLEHREYRDLGFRKIARSNLVLRDNRFRYPFGDQFPKGRVVEFAANAEHEAWMLGQWESRIADNPAM